MVVSAGCQDLCLTLHGRGVRALRSQRAPHWNQRMPMPAKTTEEAVLTASANHVSLFQLDGFIAPDRSVSTVPPGDHREMSSKVVPKMVDWPNRPRANRGK